ncbi:MAG: transcriptional regulator [Vicingaceae bacterium]|nr:MAG: transcriptional regulator [Vicingaceae bacterium]
MNIQQIKYIMAAVRQPNFEKAAEKCHVTQATLSAMIAKFEDEIEIKLFDRRKRPLQLTKEGQMLLPYFERILTDLEQMQVIIDEIKGIGSGTVKIGIIPTLAPYLMPHFIIDLSLTFPEVQFEIEEITTQALIEKIKSREIDMGIAAIPLQDENLIEIPLFQEPFYLYDSSGNIHKEFVSTADINTEILWLLDEGHCLRTQIESLCRLSQNSHLKLTNLRFKTGSIESLIKFVNLNRGQTLIPFLAKDFLDEKDKKNIKQFVEPVPGRSIGLLHHPVFPKHKIAKKLADIIKKKMAKLKTPGNIKILDPIAR